MNFDHDNDPNGSSEPSVSSSPGSDGASTPEVSATLEAPEPPAVLPPSDPIPAPRTHAVMPTHPISELPPVEHGQPRVTFFDNNKPASLNFGQAIEALKNAKLVARDGWNGKGMYLYLNPGSSPSMPPTSEHGHKMLINGIDAKLYDLGVVGTTVRTPNVNMRAADGSTVTGWLASQTDILAEDWTIIN